MSGLGWPGRSKRGAHGAGRPAAPVSGLGWPPVPRADSGADATTDVTADPTDATDQAPTASSPGAASTAEPGASDPSAVPGPEAPAVPVTEAVAEPEVARSEVVQPEVARPDVVPADAAVVERDVPAPAPVSEPIGRIRAALRDEAPVISPAGLDADPDADPHADLPIGAQAAAAVRALNPGGRHDFPKPAHRRVITVANQKGGVGKTTSTVNLAAALALHGAKVLVIDLDPQGNCSTALGVEHHSGTPNVYDVLINQVPIAEVVQPADGVANLWCVPATIDLAGAEIELVSVVARESRLQRAIEAYCAGPGADLDYVLVDCPPSLGLLTVNAMVATRELLIPIQCEYYALEGLGQLLKNVDLVRAHLNTDLHVSTILLTMYDARTKLADQVADEVRSHFGETVLRTVIPRSVRVSEAPGYGQSVVTYDPGSRGSLAYLDAARELATRGAPA